MKILYYPHEALRTKCDPVTKFNDELGRQLDDMWRLLDETPKAMALAANQVGILKRFFIMRTKDGVPYECINPELDIDEEGGRAYLREGCLSTPDIYDMISSRYKNVGIKAYDRKGKLYELFTEDIEAVCVQHETDHLDGIFWFDQMPRNPRRAMLRQWEKAKRRYR